MNFDLNWLLEKYDSEQALKYLFFWGHAPSKDGRITSSCFSQWWLADFSIDDTLYKSAEHWMMAEKARLFDDQEALQQILNTTSPGEAKKLGRSVKDFDLMLWENKRYEIVVKGNLQKFGQHHELKDFLINTGENILVEASPVDTIWGIGLAQQSKEIEDPRKWRGLNLLGFALMEVRDQLK